MEDEYQEGMKRKPDEQKSRASFVARARCELLERSDHRILAPEGDGAESIRIRDRPARVAVVRLIVPGGPKRGGKAVDAEAAIADQLLERTAGRQRMVHRLVRKEAQARPTV